MNLNDLTLGQIKELSCLFKGEQAAHPCSCCKDVWEIGKTYLIRTVTMIDTGVLVAVTDKELVLEDAAWIADTGRFSDALKSAKFNEVEPFPDGKLIVGRGSIIDAVRIDQSPRSQK